MKPSLFYQSCFPHAQKASHDSGIPALAMLTQSALETGFGNSAPGNMMFGVKAGKGWTGEKQLLTTTEVHSHPNAIYPEIISKTQRADGKWVYKVKDWFRKYPTPYESFMDYAGFIKGNPRYAKALTKTDPEQYLSEVAKAGYATDPQYFQKLQRILHDFTSLPKE